MTSQTGGTVEGPYGSWDYSTNPYTGCYYGYNADVPTCSCSGPITTVYTWQPDGDGDNPPQQVVVYEHCETEWIGKGDNIPGGSCDDGLGDSASYDYEQQPDGSYSGSGYCSGTLYQIKPGGQTITINCSPEAENDAGNDGEAFVHYWANVSPLEVVLSGGIGYSSSKHYLIGQQCHATLDPGGLTPSNYNWMATGGDVFKSWTADQTNGVLSGLGTETGDSLDCYFKKPDTGYVTCTVDLAVPSGAKPSGGFPGTQVTQTCSIDPPSASFSAYIGGVSFDDSNNAIGLTGLTPPTGFEQYGTVGITWPCDANTPSAYLSAGQGNWNYVQLTKPGRTRTNQGVDQALYLNGLICLDNSYPYGSNPSSSFPGSPPSFPADGSTDTYADGPTDTVSDGMTHLDDLDSFNTWLMYLPPGDNSCYVPIREIQWYWHGVLNFDGVGWDFTSSPNDCGWSFDGDLYPHFPEWAVYISNNDLEYTPPVN